MPSLFMKHLIKGPWRAEVLAHDLDYRTLIEDAFFVLDNHKPAP